MLVRRTLMSLALLLVVAAHAEAATVLQWSDSLDSDAPALHMIDRIAKRVAETTKGRVTIQAFPLSELSSKDRFENVAAGTQQVTMMNPGPLSHVVPAFGVLEAPYVWRDPAHLLTVMNGPIGQDLSRKLVDERGIRVLATTYFGTRHVTTAKQPVHAVADMRGLRLRVPQNSVFLTMARAWGAAPAPVALGAVHMALRQNLIDGQEDFLFSIDSYKLFDVQKYLVLTGHILMPRLVLMNEKVWQGLGSADQTALAAAVAEGIAWQNQEVEAREKKLLDKLKQGGMEIIQPDVESFRKPVVATMPKIFDARWGAGLYQRIVDTK